MDTNEIMEKNEVIEVTEEIATTDFSKECKMAAGIGLAVVGGVITYKYVVKPLIAKIKCTLCLAGRRQNTVDADYAEVDDEDEYETVVDEV